MSASVGQLGLLFFIIALTAGAFLRYVLKDTKIPYTVALLVFGLGMGWLAKSHFVHHTFSEAVRLSSHIDPHLILYLFLPTLIFEAAFLLDTHVFQRSLKNILILAVPGLILSTVLTGVLVKFFPYDMTWPMVFMFGALISATDPVAVVALLKDVGASKRLSTVIEGESLLNDGVAIVLFMLFYQVVRSGGAVTTFGAVTANFLWVVGGGLLVGGVLALIAIMWIRRIFSDAILEITITMAFAYLTFYVAEAFLHVSGILAVVSFGLILTGIGQTRISPEVREFLHQFWEMLAYIANTLIFILVGVVIAEHTQWVTLEDWAMLAVLYVGIHAVRAIMLGIFYKPMAKGNYGLDKKDLSILWK